MAAIARIRAAVESSAGKNVSSASSESVISTGVPTFVFAQKYVVSGAQPAEQLARAIRQVSAEVNAQAAE